MPENESCVFCDMAAGKIPANKLWEDDDIIAFHDINPQAPLHILIIPRRHIATLNDLSEDDSTLVGKLFLVARELAKKEGVAEKGYRTVINCNQAAGQSVPHIHLHLLGGRSFTWPPG